MSGYADSKRYAQYDRDRKLLAELKAFLAAGGDPADFPCEDLEYRPHYLTMGDILNLLASARSQ